MRRGGASDLAAASLLALSLLGSSGARAQEEEAFGESIDVAVANVEVYVTDRQGRPVTGLGRDDFQLFEADKPVAISNFYAAEATGTPAASAVATGAAAPAASPPAQTTRTTVPPGVPAEQRLYLALFVDGTSLTPVARNQVLRQVRELLGKGLKSEDRVLLATYDGGSLRLRQAPTADPAALDAALEQASKGTARGIAPLSDERLLLRDLTLADVEQAASVKIEFRAFIQRRENEIRTTLRTLEDFVSSLAGLPGRKALFYVGGGLSLRPGDALLRAWNVKFGSQSDLLEGVSSPIEPLLHQLAEHANASRVTFYALGVSESSTGLSADSEYSEEWSRAGLEAVEAAHKSNSLFDLATDTGGLAVADARRAGPLLARVRRDLDSYYSLGFTPQGPRDGEAHRIDGEAHRIKVVVRGDGLEVRYRDRYRNLSDGERLVARARAALLFGTEDNPYDVAVEFGSGEAHGDSAWTVPVLVKFPMSRLSLLPHDTLQEGRMRLFIGAKDERGRVSRISEIAVPVRVANETLASSLEKLGACQVKLDMRAGANQVVVALWDEVAREESIVLASHTVGGEVPR